MVYGYYEGTMFITKGPSPTFYSLLRYVIGHYNIKAKRQWAYRMRFCK